MQTHLPKQRSKIIKTQPNSQKTTSFLIRSYSKPLQLLNHQTRSKSFLTMHNTQFINFPSKKRWQLKNENNRLGHQLKRIRTTSSCIQQYIDNHSFVKSFSKEKRIGTYERERQRNIKTENQRMIDAIFKIRVGKSLKKVKQEIEKQKKKKRSKIQKNKIKFCYEHTIPIDKDKIHSLSKIKIQNPQTKNIGRKSKISKIVAERKQQNEIKLSSHNMSHSEIEAINDC